MTDRIKNMSNDLRLRRTTTVGGVGQVGGIGPVSGGKKPQGIQPGVKTPSFEDVLGRISASKEEVKISKHAADRLASRNIQLSSEDMGKINDAVNKAEAKGIKEALILMNDKVFIANIKNRTIITASTESDLKDNVFTNIDGAVIV